MGERMVTAKDFVVNFAEAYNECRGYFTDPAQWSDIWTKHWSRFVLWNPLPPQPKPLMKLVAEKLGLLWWDREPFRLAGAMIPADYQEIGNYPVPLLIGIEHENNVSTFVEEIVKLAHVICPLKVGVTYVLGGSALPSAGDVTGTQERILRLAQTALCDRNRYVGEDPASEFCSFWESNRSCANANGPPWRLAQVPDVRMLSGQNYLTRDFQRIRYGGGPGTGRSDHESAWHP